MKQEQKTLQHSAYDAINTITQMEREMVAMYNQIEELQHRLSATSKELADLKSANEANKEELPQN